MFGVTTRELLQNHLVQGHWEEGTAPSRVSAACGEGQGRCNAPAITQVGQGSGHCRPIVRWGRAKVSLVRPCHILRATRRG